MKRRGKRSIWQWRIHPSRMRMTIDRRNPVSAEYPGHPRKLISRNTSHYISSIETGARIAWQVSQLENNIERELRKKR